jgi:hypothetical protein
VQERDLKQRVLLFLYGTPNLVGSLLGLAGIALYFLGVIDRFWPLIVAGLYGIGYLVTPSRPQPELLSDLDQASLRDAIDRLRRRVKGKLPIDAAKLMESVLASAETILPKLDELHKKGSIVTDETFTVRETLIRYLPETLEAYLRLPPAYASVHAVKDGKPARRLLTEQLQFLDERFKIMVGNVLEEDVQALEANGRFLQERFGRPDLLAPPAAH